MGLAKVTGLESRAMPLQDMGGPWQGKSRAEREDAGATVLRLRRSEARMEEAALGRGANSAPIPAHLGLGKRTWGDIPRPSCREGPWPLACGLPFLPLSHRVPLPGLRASDQASSKLQLFAIHISTPEE